jgi:hypothetical protein
MFEDVLKRQFLSGTIMTLTWLTIIAALLLLLPESQAVVQLVAPTSAAKNESIASAQTTQAAKAAQAAPTKIGKRYLNRSLIKVF